MGTHLWRDPARLLDANAYHPHPQALLYAETLLVEGAAAGLLLPLLGDAAPVLNVLTVLTVAASLHAFHLLARALGVGHAVVHPRRWEEERRRYERRLLERASLVPVVARFPEPADPLLERYRLGGEMVVALPAAAEVPAPAACPCRPIAPASLRASASLAPGRAAAALDGDPSTRWTTAPADQQAGAWFEIALDRPRVVARVEVAMRFPYGEFGRDVEVLGRAGGAWRRMGPRNDVGGLVALVRQVVDDPSRAWLSYPLAPAPVEAVRLVLSRPVEPATGPWSLPEIRVLELTGDVAPADPTGAQSEDGSSPGPDPAAGPPPAGQRP